VEEREGHVEGLGRLTTTDRLICKGCGSGNLEVILSLGEQPLANALRTIAEADAPEPRYPLDVAFCAACSLTQLTVSVPPEILFAEYAYFSSYSPSVVSNARDLVADIVRTRQLDGSDLAMEIASNDGYLLRHYQQAGVPVLGIDPAENVAAVAIADGVPTLCEFFGARIGEQLRAAGHRASVVHAHNVLAHVPDISGMLHGIASVLRDDGRVIIETPYVRDLVDRVEFDTVYHEHLFYYSLTSLDRLLSAHGLGLVDVERIPIHGGSLRVTAALDGAAPTTDTVAVLLDEESRLGIDQRDYYRDFGARVAHLCAELHDLILRLRGAGRRIAGYGAAAKATVLLNTLGIGHEAIEFVVDRNPHKQGRLVPGTRIPILPVEHLVEEHPDDTVLFVWNFADEVLEQQSEYRARGGRFLIPIPEPRLV
jgi:SAM-dependent methyltransferase